MATLFKLDSHGNPFIYRTLELKPAEYARIISEINNCYSVYEGQRFCMHESYDFFSGAYVYYFENHGFNDYNIYQKEVF